VIHPFFLLSPVSMAPKTDHLSRKQCRAAPSWLHQKSHDINRQLSWVWHRISQWRWIRELSIMKNLLSASTLPDEHRRWLKRALHYQACVSILNFIREAVSETRCFLHIISSFLPRYSLLSPSTWKTLFELVLMHLAVFFFLVCRDQHKAVARRRSASVPSARTSSRTPWWKRRNVHSGGIEAANLTAAERILQRMRAPQIPVQQHAVSKLHPAAPLQVRVSDTEAASISEQPTPSSAAAPVSAVTPSPSISRSHMLPHHPSASSHVVAPLIPPFPFAVARSLLQQQLAYDTASPLEFGRIMFVQGAAPGQRPSSQSVSHAQGAQPDTQGIQAHSLAHIPSQHAQAQQADPAEPAEATHHAADTQQAQHREEETYDELGPNI
jgi:hypothetical protein